MSDEEFDSLLLAESSDAPATWIILPSDIFGPRCECIDIKAEDGAIVGFRLCDRCLELMEKNVSNPS